MPASTDLVVTIQATIEDYDGLEELIAEMVEAVKEKDPATRQYNFSVDEAKKTLFVMERYASADAFFAHTKTLGPFAERFFGKIEMVSAAVHRAPGVELPPALEEALAPFGTAFMTFVGSFESFSAP